MMNFEYGNKGPKLTREPNYWKNHAPNLYFWLIEEKLLQSDILLTALIDLEKHRKMG